MNNNPNQKELYTPNQILNNWNPTKWGFSSDIYKTPTENTDIDHKLIINDNISIQITATVYKDNPKEIVEQAVELCTNGQYHLLAHIDSKTKIGTLIRSLSGKPPAYFAKKASRQC